MNIESSLSNQPVHTVSVYHYYSDEDQGTFYGKFMQKTSEFKRNALITQKHIQAAKIKPYCAPGLSVRVLK